jgi:hypothetical protein
MGLVIVLNAHRQHVEEYQDKNGSFKPVTRESVGT